MSALDLRDMSRPAAWDSVASDYGEVISEHLGRYAGDAIELVGLRAGERALDVATGPGTLARRAARITRVDALDFSRQMLAELRRRATPEELENLEVRRGDGQALPYDGASFDVAFSIFGLFLFPDRTKGFSELSRVLRPGGRAVVASWQPQQSIAAFDILGDEVLREAGIEKPAQPLADKDELAAEMSAAGFAVEVHESVHTWSCPSLEALWTGLERSNAALAVARDQLSATRYAALVERIRRRLHQELGDGPQEIVMPAWLALGRLDG